MAKRGRPKKADPVNSPSHYKYLWRADKKEGNEGSQDTAKAIWYLRFARNDDPRLDN